MNVICNSLQDFVSLVPVVAKGTYSTTNNNLHPLPAVRGSEFDWYCNNRRDCPKSEGEGPYIGHGDLVDLYGKLLLYLCQVGYASMVVIQCLSMVGTSLIGAAKHCSIYRVRLLSYHVGEQWDIWIHRPLFSIDVWNLLYYLWSVEIQVFVEYSILSAISSSEGAQVLQVWSHLAKFVFYLKFIVVRRAFHALSFIALSLPPSWLSVPEGAISTFFKLRFDKLPVLEIFLHTIQVFERWINLSTAFLLPDYIRKMRECCTGLTVKISSRTLRSTVEAFSDIA